VSNQKGISSLITHRLTVLSPSHHIQPRYHMMLLSVVDEPEEAVEEDLDEEEKKKAAKVVRTD